IAIGFDVDGDEDSYRRVTDNEQVYRPEVMRRAALRGGSKEDAFRAFCARHSEPVWQRRTLGGCDKDKLAHSLHKDRRETPSASLERDNRTAVYLHDNPQVHHTPTNDRHPTFGSTPTWPTQTASRWRTGDRAKRICAYVRSKRCNDDRLVTQVELGKTTTRTPNIGT